MSRVLVVGWDGATFDIIRPLIARGRLPNLARLMESGASGTLRSTIPPVTPAAWTTFFTGKNPGKHGIYDFQTLVPGSYEFRTVRTDLHREKTLWQILGEAGKRSIIWDVPFTYPPRPLEGWMLTGYGTPNLEDAIFTYPYNLVDLIPAEYRQEIRVALPKVRFNRSQSFIDEWERVMEGRRRLLPWLVREQEWDLFMVVFSITDNMAHVFWTYIDPSHPNYLRPEGERFREAFFGAYETCDQILGELIGAAGSDTTTIVISDHGFGSVRPRQYIHQRLMQGGYIVPGGSKRIGPRAQMMKMAADIYIRYPKLREWVKGMGAGSRNRLKRSLNQAGVLPNQASIEYARSKVIPTNFGLRMWLNDKERFPTGVVQESDFEPLLAELTEYLMSDRDPINGRKILNAVHSGADLYQGPEVGRAPDLVIEYANHFQFDAPPLGKNPYTEGGHTLDGILIAAGLPMKHGEVSDLSLTDLAPTILHLMGQPVPPDMDGRVEAAMFTDENLDQNPMELGCEEARNETSPDMGAYGEEEEAKILEQLKKLGYV